MTAPEVGTWAWFAARSQAREWRMSLPGILWRLERAAGRYASAAARNPGSDHLWPMLHTCQALAREAFARGGSLEDVAGACGLTGTGPAWLGLNDAEQAS